MPGDKPTYNPDEFNDDKNQTEEEKEDTAKKRDEMRAKLAAKTREKKDAESQPKLGTPKQTIRSGLGVNQRLSVLRRGRGDERDKNEVQEDREAAMERLKNKIRDLLKSYKLHDVKPRVTVSDDREKYVLKLLKDTKTVGKFEDRFENILSRLEEYLKNEYGD